MALYIQLSTQSVLTKALSVSSITGGNSVNTEQLISTVFGLQQTSVVPLTLSTSLLIASSITTSSITASTIQAPIMSTLVLYASSIVGVVTGGGGLATLPSTISSFAVLTSSIQTSTLTASVLSTQQLFASSIQGNVVSTIQVNAGSLIGTTLFVSSGLVSTLSTNTLNFAGGFGYLTMPDIYPNTVYTSTVTASNLLVGWNSVQSPIQFFGFGTYSNTVIAELSTGAANQELVMFRGSNASDRIRMQTTGSIVFEPGVSQRLWPTVPSNVTPAMLINTSSNVGIQTANPGATLDVAGTGRFQTVSTLALNISTINGQVYGSGLASLPSTVSTFALLASSIRTSTLTTTQTAYLTSAMLGNNALAPQTTLDVVGEGTFRYQANLASNTYGRNVDTLLLNSPTPGNSNAAASLMFGTSTVGFPLARIGAFDYGYTTTAGTGLVFQVANASTNSALSGVASFGYTGSLGTYTVGAGITSLEVILWGAGGGASGNYIGGPGAFARGTIAVTAGQQLRVLVGKGGLYANTGSFGGGGSGGGSGNGAAGGGRTSIQRLLAASVTGISGNGTTVTYTTSAAHGLVVGQPVIISGVSPSGYTGSFLITAISTTSPFSFSVSNTTTGTASGTAVVYSEVVIVAGGGGAAQDVNGGSAVGGYGGLVNGGNGGGILGDGAGFGATQSNAGAGTGGGTNGSFLQGANSSGGGGGGGYWGGGGGDSFYGGGGGGGSSYLSNVTITSSGQTTSGATAPGNTDPYYLSGVAVGGATSGGSGGDGYAVILTSPSYVLSEAMRIDYNNNVGINNSVPSTTLDVGGTTRTQVLQIGIVSTVNSLQYAGLFGNYNNTVLSEISTGAGTQELLVFKGSSTSDRVRVQTTGAFVVETGVSARLFNSNTTQTLSNVTPAFVINTSSNVGIQTANPGATLDVAGTGRFQLLSTLGLNVSTINGTPYTPASGGTFLIPSTFSTVSLLTSSVTTSTLQAITLSSLTLTVSSFYTATRQATPMFVTF